MRVAASLCRMSSLSGVAPQVKAEGVVHDGYRGRLEVRE